MISGDIFFILRIIDDKDKGALFKNCLKELLG